MRVQASLGLILSLGSLTGCTSTTVYDFSEPSERAAFVQKKSGQIQLIDGAKTTGHDFRLEPDTLLFAVGPARWHTHAVSRDASTDGERLKAVTLSEIVQASTKTINAVKTTALVVATPAIVLGAVFVICNSGEAACAGG